MYAALKKRNVVKILGVVALAATIAVSVFLGVYFGKAEPTDNVGLETKSEQTAGLRLALSPLNAAANGETYSQTITATVLPEDAPDKSVDWSISWADDAPLKDSDISAYLTITPASDGATTATITCKKTFRGSNAIINCTTRVGGVSSICFVSFKGLPNAINVDTSKYTYVAAANYNTWHYKVSVGDNVFPVSLENLVGDLSPEYYSKITVSIESVGFLGLQDRTEDASGYSWLDGTYKSVSLESIKNVFAECSYNASTRKITLRGKKTFSNYYEGVSGGSSAGKRLGAFKACERDSVAGVNAYLFLRISCPEVGLTKDIPFEVVSSVNGVSLDSYNISF